MKDKACQGRAFDGLAGPGPRAQGIILPDVNAPEAAVVDNTKVLGMNNLPAVIAFLRGEKTVEPFVIDLTETMKEHSVYEEDFSEVKGQEHSKRALRLLRQEGIMF